MAILAGAILRTSMNFELADGTLYQNVYQHRRVGPGLVLTDAQHVAAINTWATAMYDELAAKVSVGTVAQLSSVDRVEFVVDQWEVTENIGTFTFAFTPTALASAAMPNQISPFVTFKTARPKTIGRKFLFPMSEEEFLSGLLSAGAVAAIVGYADDALANIPVDAPLDYLVPLVIRTGVDAHEDYTLAIVTNLAGTQRRRRRGAGA